jgi:hypothetical protein
MPTWKEGDRVRVVDRPVTEADRKSNRYFEHMAGLSGTIQNIYSADEIAIKIDLPDLSDVTKDVHKHATLRMREKFVSSVSEEQKKQLTGEELNFEPHYVLLVRGADLEKA